MERKRMVANERDALMDLALIVELVLSAEEGLDKRSRVIKGTRKWMGLLKYCAEKIYQDMLNSIPVEQLLAFQHNIACMSFTRGAMRPGGSVRSDDYGLWLSFRDLAAITEAGKEKCLTCDLCDGRERQCELRKALDNLGSDVEHDDKGSGCAYRWI